ncbi:MAG TPA: GAF domain-containing protein [Gemmataceae bacterium]
MISSNQAVAAPRAAEDASRILARLAEPPDLPLPELFRRACEAGGECLGVDRTGVWLFVNSEKLLRCVNHFDRASAKHTKGACLSLGECPGFLRTLSTATVLPLRADGAEAHSRDLARAYLAPRGIDSLLCAPLRRDGRVVGVAFFESLGPRNWSERDFAFARGSAELFVARMQAAEGALRRPVCPPAPANVTPIRLAEELRNLLGEIEATARAGPVTADRFKRVAETAARGAVILHTLYPALRESAERETLSGPTEDDTGEHQPIA